jgi:hypothetical protein
MSTIHCIVYRIRTRIIGALGLLAQGEMDRDKACEGKEILRELIDLDM